MSSAKAVSIPLQKQRKNTEKTTNYKPVYKQEKIRPISINTLTLTLGLPISAMIERNWIKFTKSHKISRLIGTAKLEQLKQLIAAKVQNLTKKTDVEKRIARYLSFTAFADTANYLYDNLYDWAKETLNIESAVVTGGASRSDLVRNDFDEILTNFSPISKERDEGETEAEMMNCQKLICSSLPIVSPKDKTYKIATISSITTSIGTLSVLSNVSDGLTASVARTRKSI